MNIDIGFLMEQNGETYVVTRGPDSFETMGLKNKEKDGTPYVGFYPDTDVRAGDRLKGQVSGNEYQVHRTENTMLMGRVFQLKAYTRATASLPSTSHIYVGSMVNSAIQQGSPGATQTVTISQNSREAIESVIREVTAAFEKLNLSSDELNELSAEIDTIKAQLKSANPKPGLLTACLASIRTELEKVAARCAGLAAGAVATGLIKQIAMICGF